MATAKKIQEYLLEYGEGWAKNGSFVTKNHLPLCGQANMGRNIGFDTRNDYTDDSVIFYRSQEDLDGLNLTQAIQLINEKTGDNIPLPQQEKNMKFSEKTIKELEEFGFKKRGYKYTEGEFYIFKDRDCEIKCLPRRFYLIIDNEEHVALEKEIPIPPNLNLVKIIYKELFGKELEPKPKQKDYSFSALSNEGKVLVQHNYYSPTEDISQAVTLYAKLMHVRWEIEKGINNHEGGLVTLLSDGRIKGCGQEIDQEEWQNYYLVFAKKEQAKVFAASEENMRMYKEFLHYNNQ